MSLTAGRRAKVLALRKRGQRLRSVGRGVSGVVQRRHSSPRRRDHYTSAPTPPSSALHTRMLRAGTPSPRFQLTAVALLHAINLLRQPSAAGRGHLLQSECRARSTSGSTHRSQDSGPQAGALRGCARPRGAPDTGAVRSPKRPCPSRTPPSPRRVRRRDLPEIRKVGRDDASAQAERREQSAAAGDRTIWQQDSVARGREIRELLFCELPIDHDAGHTPDCRKNGRRVELIVANAADNELHAAVQPFDCPARHVQPLIRTHPPEARHDRTSGSRRISARTSSRERARG